MNATAAGVVLVGGRSSRMGTPKADLEWHGSTLLRRTTDVLARSVSGPVVVVRAAGQPLPRLDHAVTVVDDPEPGRGPVLGLATGLTAASAAGATTAFVCATDLPFLHPAYVRRLLGLLDDDHEVALPHLGGFPQPLAAAYRTSLAGVLTDMASAQQWRLRALFDRCRVRELDGAALLAGSDLAELDPGLDSVVNVNSPDDYRAARARPGPVVTVLHLGRAHRVEAATLAEAATAVGAPAPVPREGERPLVSGDRVELD
ncbi:molybdenum cofactor guanylyltransferase [Pseudonocardia spinosispora]|uniref:molybdenum cofactor guanylyltransferase n=1 Tax=Pseudonocardia spinosispora TaxID=103441 RepID=UPI0004130487|nr:molybdenum cofactor guanylyltransferase [Pseudonocardia spinosispora]